MLSLLVHGAMAAALAGSPGGVRLEQAQLGPATAGAVAASSAGHRLAPVGGGPLLIVIDRAAPLLVDAPGAPLGPPPAGPAVLPPAPLLAVVRGDGLVQSPPATPSRSRLCQRPPARPG